MLSFLDEAFAWGGDERTIVGVKRPSRSETAVFRTVGDAGPYKGWNDRDTRRERSAPLYFEINFIRGVVFSFCFCYNDEGDENE